jgi:hypothetical protein
MFYSICLLTVSRCPIFLFFFCGGGGGVGGGFCREWRMFKERVGILYLLLDCGMLQIVSSIIFSVTYFSWFWLHKGSTFLYLVESKGFWRWCTTLRNPAVLRPYILSIASCESTITAATTGLLYQPRMMIDNDDVEQSMDWVAGETEALGGNLFHFHFVHHKSRMTRLPGLEPAPSQWEASD